MNAELESLSPKQRLLIRAARSSSEQEHLEVLRMMERRLSSLALLSAEQILEQAAWSSIAGAFFEHSDVGDRKCTIESFRSYAADFFGDRRRLNRAVAQGEDARDVELKTRYWKERSEDYPSVTAPGD